MRFTRLTIFLACALSLIAPAVAATSVPSGFYMLSGGQPPAPPTAAILQQHFVDGFSLRIDWSIVEPLSGQYDFSAIDAALAALFP
jgi:hypothetical protein